MSVKSRDAFEDGVGFRVAAKRCDQCLYSKNKIVTDDRRVELLESCNKDDKYFICHKAHGTGAGVVCRGFYDEQKNTACQIAGRLGLTVFVDPANPPKAKKPRSKGATAKKPTKRAVGEAE